MIFINLNERKCFRNFEFKPKNLKTLKILYLIEKQLFDMVLIPLGIEYL